MTDKKHIIDKVNDDDTKIVMSSKSVKWILGILGGAILSLGSLAWGLYIKVDAKVDAKFEEVTRQAKENQDVIMEKLEALEDKDVKENTKKNYEQDAELGILFDRTNSRRNVNDNATRPTDNSNGPVINP